MHIQYTQVSISDDNLMLRQELPKAHQGLKLTLEKAESDQSAAKENFRDQLTKLVNDFVKEVEEVRSDFTATAPLSSEDHNLTDSMEYIEKWTEKLRNIRVKEVQTRTQNRQAD